MTTLTRIGTKPGQASFATPAASAGSTAADYVRRERAYGARNYDPLPAVLSQGEGSWLTDVEGRRYLDLMSAYSAVSFGHGHPRIVAALVEQASRLAVTSRAYHTDQLAPLAAQVCELTWQLRGQAGERQVAGAKVGITANQGLFGHGSSVIVKR